MKKGDFLWLFGLIGIIVLLVLPVTHEPIMAGTKQHPVVAGFIKFFILASMGDLLALRIVHRTWKKPEGFIYRMLVWGVLGAMITIVFDIFSNGATGAIGKGFLPVGTGALALLAGAFWISFTMNVTFGPMMMFFHRFTDTFIDLAQGRLDKFSAVSVKMVVDHIDWKELVSLAVKINLCVWLPCHTAVFLLPPEYRVLAAAFLSILLGAILGYAKSRKLKTA